MAPEQQQRLRFDPITLGQNYALKEGIASLLGIGAGSLPAAPEVLSIGGQAPVAASSPFALGGIGAAGNVILPALGAYGAHELFSTGARKQKAGEGALVGAASGAALGSFAGPPGAIIGAALGGLTGFARNAFGSGKHKDQLQRDGIRSELSGSGFVSGGKNNTDISLGGVQADLGSSPYNVQFQTGDANRDKTVAEVVGLIDPWAEMFSQGDAKRRSDLTGMFANVALQAEDPIKAVVDIYRKGEATYGLRPDEMMAGVQGLLAQGKIDAARGQGLLNSLARVREESRRY